MKGTHNYNILLLACIITDVSQVRQSQHVGISVDLVDGHNASES